MSNDTKAAGRALMARLREKASEVKAAEAKGDTHAMEEAAKEADTMMREGLAELGYDKGLYRRIRNVNNPTRLAHHDKVIAAVRELGAIATTTRFRPLAEVAHAALDDLTEVMRVARSIDLLLGSMDADTGAGGFCQFPVRLDADVTQFIRDYIDGNYVNEEANKLDKVLGSISAAMGNGSGAGEFSPFTLMGLVMLGERIGKALAPLVEFAGKGNLKTAKALRALVEAQFRAAAEGKALNESEGLTELGGRNLYYWFDEVRTEHANALLRVMDYVLEHGSDEDFDVEGAKAELREKLAAVSPEAVERFDRAQAKAREELKNDSPHFHARHRATT